MKGDIAQTVGFLLASSAIHVICIAAVWYAICRFRPHIPKPGNRFVLLVVGLTVALHFLAPRLLFAGSGVCALAAIASLPFWIVSFFWKPCSAVGTSPSHGETKVMDYLKWQCPSCKQSLEAPADMAGEDIECPTCKRRILIWAATKTNTLNEAGGFGNATPQSSADEIVYAGFWRRAFAVLFDLSLLHLACYAPLFVLGFILPSRMLDALVQLLNFAPIQLVCLHYPYFTGYECSRYQATLGKQLFGIMVQTKDGHPMSGAQATGRYWAKILSALPLMAGFIIVAFDKKKQGFHDKIVGATVIRGWPNGEKRKELPVWLLALTVTGVCSIDGGLFFYNNEHFFVNEPFLVRLCGGILSAAAVYGWILFVLICVVMAIQKRRQIQLEKRRTITG